MAITYFQTADGVIGYSQKNYRLKRHAHFPIEAVFALSGQLHIGTDNHQYSNIRAALINTNVPHRFCCLNAACQLYFIDPSRDIGQHLLQHFFRREEEMVVIDDMEHDRFVDNHITAYDNQNTRFHGIDKRIQRCVEWIEANYAAEGIRVSRLCTIAYLSEGRLAHLFKDQMGISIRQYILWKKIEMGMKHFTEGCSLTDCAYLSGFVDLSHLTKTFKKMFGIPPSFES